MTSWKKAQCNSGNEEFDLVAALLFSWIMRYDDVSHTAQPLEAQTK